MIFVFPQAGYFCRVCDCVVKDSANYLDHINGKKRTWWHISKKSNSTSQVHFEATELLDGISSLFSICKLNWMVLFSNRSKGIGDVYAGGEIVTWTSKIFSSIHMLICFLGVLLMDESETRVLLVLMH